LLTVRGVLAASVPSVRAPGLLLVVADGGTTSLTKEARMKHQGIRRSAKIFLSCVLLSLSLGACAAEDLEPTSSDEAALSTAPSDEAPATQAPVDEALQARPMCCSYGSYDCPSNPDASADYDPPGCGMYTKPRARTICNAHCATACVDSGWFDSCN
jgi:hypothetical protein